MESADPFPRRAGTEADLAGTPTCPAVTEESAVPDELVVTDESTNESAVTDESATGGELVRHADSSLARLGGGRVLF